MKKLYKSRNNKVIAGVCGGIAEYFDIDPVLVRIIAVLFLFAGGAAFIAYILGMIIIPSEPLEMSQDGVTAQSPSVAAPKQPESSSRSGALIIGVVMIVFGVGFLLRNIPFFDTYYWYFWRMGRHFFWPSILIFIGLLLILRGAKK